MYDDYIVCNARCILCKRLAHTMYSTTYYVQIAYIVCNVSYILCKKRYILCMLWLHTMYLAYILCEYFTYYAPIVVHSMYNSLHTMYESQTPPYIL